MKDSTFVIQGVGYDENHTSCFHKAFLHKIKGELPHFFLSNTFDRMADVYIANLSRESIKNGLMNSIPKDDSFVILIVHELSRYTIPYLKLGDHLIFINELQEFVCCDLMELDYPHSVMHYPSASYNHTGATGDYALILFDDHLIQEEQYYLERLGWMRSDTFFTKVFINNSSDQHNKFDLIKAVLLSHFQNIEVLRLSECSFEDLEALTYNAKAFQYSKSEPDVSEYLEEMQNKGDGILYTPLRESLLLATCLKSGGLVKPMNSLSYFNFNKMESVSIEEWRSHIAELIKAHAKEYIHTKPIIVNHAQVDQLEDLNIVYGAPLKNDYIASVCFRNQEGKIERCLDSILSQKGNFDLGIVIVSDVSTDRSLELIIEKAKSSFIPFCVVDNKDRKLLSRNTYNVVHRLTINDESVIFEVDGDDFLASDQVIKTIHAQYAKGMLKTNGSYQAFPFDLKDAFSQETAFNHSNFDLTHPWSLKCSSWLHLKSAKRKLYRQVELKYFLERKTGQWLTERIDSAIQPRMIELSDGKTVFIAEVLYNYDLSGEFHDHQNIEENFKFYRMVDKLYHPIDLMYN